MGYSLIYKETGIINFAQGEFAMIGAMSLWMFQQQGWPLIPALIAAVAVAAVVGAGISRIVMHPARHSAPLTLIFITLGLDTALRGIATLLWGVNPVAVNPLSGNGSIHLIGAVLSVQNLWVLLGAAVVALALYLFLERTYLGRGMEAAMDNPQAAQLFGMDPLKFSLYTWISAAIIGAVGGALLAPITTANANMGLDLGLSGFVGAIIGGIDSLPGAALGGLVLGLVQSVAAGYVSSTWADGIAYAVLFLVLLVRPQGLMGSHAQHRV
ncbi:MAG: branched-chain amino acid ABC transporter permease [Sulfobacillus benefaciens]|uniref:Branched-chain amino acid ABC transporter permease n=1 Tax=Sulfobacillus benefaciens TaxID=453960 RepID=A0A2T2XGK3_9FIRM|nr:MAG: branched-chain amino acid ABC transporter permease [Sulfobacillus benefaciens]